MQDWEWFVTAPLDVLLHIHSTGEWLLPANYGYNKAKKICILNTFVLDDWLKCRFLPQIGTPIYNLFTTNVIPIRRRPWSLSRRLKYVNRMKRRDRLCHKKRKDRRQRKRRRKKRQIECSQDDEPPSKRLRLEVPPTAILSENQPSATTATLTGGMLV